MNGMTFEILVSRAYTAYLAKILKVAIAVLDKERMYPSSEPISMDIVKCDSHSSLIDVGSITFYHPEENFGRARARKSVLTAPISLCAARCSPHYPENHVVLGAKVVVEIAASLEDRSAISSDICEELKTTRQPYRTPNSVITHSHLQKLQLRAPCFGL